MPPDKLQKPRKKADALTPRQMAAQLASLQAGLPLDALPEDLAAAHDAGQDPYQPADEGYTAAFIHETPGPLPGVPATRASSPKPAGHRSASGPATVEGTTPKAIIEALLFVGQPDGSPLTSEQAAQLMRGVSASEIDDLVDELRREYDAHGCPYTVESHGAGYMLVLRPEFKAVKELLKSRTRRFSLSPPAMEVLSLVAYRGPLTMAEMEEARGNACRTLVNQLVRGELLETVASSEPKGKPSYRTTAKFLGLFGLSSLEDLPQREDMLGE